MRLERNNSYFFDSAYVMKESCIARFASFTGSHGLISSSGQLKRLVETDFDTMHPIMPDARLFC